MSLLIKGMDMPSACNKCRFHNADICIAKGSKVSLQIYLNDEKPCDCPLAEVPTHHGRLVNADEAVIYTVKAVQEYYHQIYGNESYAHDGVYDVIEKVIDEVSEVVEAEE